MKSLLCLVILLSAHCQVSSFLLGSKKCTYGPSYWCANFANAKECSATQHCIDNDWKKTTSQSKAVHGKLEESACTFCKDIVGDIADFIADNATRAEILNYLDEACGYMPDTFSVDKCKEISEHYLDEVLKAVESAVDPDTVCSLLMLCNQGNHKQRDLLVSARKPATVNKFSARVGAVVKDDETCTICKTAESFIKTEVDDKNNQAAMIKFLQTQCEKLGGDLAPECESLINIAVPELVSLLDSNLNSQLCVALGMCSASVQEMAAAKETVTKSLSTLLRSPRMKTHIVGIASRVRADECTTCEEIFNYIHLFIDNNSTAGQVKDLLENDVCPELSEFADTCKELVEVYFPQIWKMLVDALEPKTVCTELGFCNSSQSVSKQPKTEVSLKNSVGCVLCQFVMDKLASLITEKSTEEEIKTALDKVCSLLPSSIETDCDDFVDKYSEEIFELLAKGIVPEAVCTAIGLCSTAEVKTVNKLGDENCIMCKMAMDYVKSALSKNATQQEIMAELEKVCSYLPAELTSECKTMIDQYGPQILDMISSKLDSDQICKALGLCTASSASVQKGKANGLVQLYKSADRASNI